MKNAGSPTEGIEQKNRGNSKKRKLYPVQDEDVALLGRLSQSRNRAVVGREVEQHRLGRYVIVPQIVMHRLEMPHHFPGRCVQCHDGTAVVIEPLAHAAVMIGLCIARRHENQAVLVIHRHGGPNIGRIAGV